MPARIFPYLKGLLQGFKPTATFLQTQFGFSHDQLTRTLQKKFSWKHLLLLIIQRLFGLLRYGYLIIDDTVIAKPYARNLEGAGFAYSSSLDKTVYGYHVVLLVWTNGIVTLPLSWRFYRKEDGKSKIKLAAELLEEAKTVWKLTPFCCLFDSWYSAEKLLNQIEEYGWTFVCQIKKNRIVSCAPIAEDLIENGNFLYGVVTSQIKGFIFRYEDKFFLTNNLLLTQKEVIFYYSFRWKVEEVFRFLKDQLHLENCQARSKTAQENHLGSCILAYLLIQREQLGQSAQSLYAIKWSWLLNKRLGNNRFRHYVKVLSA